MQHVNLHPTMTKYLNRRHDIEWQRDQELALNIETSKLLTKMFRRFPGKVTHTSTHMRVELAEKRCLMVKLGYGLSEDGYNLVMGWSSMIGNYVEQHDINFNLMHGDLFNSPVQTIHIGSLYAILRSQYELWDTK